MDPSDDLFLQVGAASAADTRAAVEAAPAKLLAAIDAAFGDTPRPSHFLDFTHCDDCAAYDATLLAHTPDTIRPEHLGELVWEPICFLNTQGYHYYMAALARFALTGRGLDAQFPHFLSSLSPDRIAAFNPAQRAAVLALLEFMNDQMKDLVAESFDEKTLHRRLRRLRVASAE